MGSFDKNIFSFAVDWTNIKNINFGVFLQDCKKLLGAEFFDFYVCIVFIDLKGIVERPPFRDSSFETINICVTPFNCNPCSPWTVWSVVPHAVGYNRGRFIFGKKFRVMEVDNRDIYGAGNV